MRAKVRRCFDLRCGEIMLIAEKREREYAISDLIANIARSNEVARFHLPTDFFCVFGSCARA